MCRFLIYKGPEVLMADLVSRAEQSLIRQSYRAREHQEPLNGDGFGVGWYDHRVDETPCIFTSTSPAWSNRNLLRLASKVRSPCLFAHVRAATPGQAVSEFNCHPFQHQQYMWMHNGSIGEFAKIRRRLRESLSDEAYDLVQGTTDSEHAFALFLDIIASRSGEDGVADLSAAMIETINRLNAWTLAAGIGATSRYNFAVTDGHSVVATRFVSPSEQRPHSLYFATGAAFENIDGAYHVRSSGHGRNAAIIASEPLTDDRSEWTAVPENHLIAISPDTGVRTLPIH